MDVIKPLNIKRIYKVIFSALAAGILALCSLLVFAGCGNNISYKDAIELAKEDYGCKKILWVGHVTDSSDNPLLGDASITPDGGYGVVGLDKNGNEMYVLFPTYISDKYKPTKVKWPFDYSFAQIIDFAGEYGYKYSNGIDERVDEFVEDPFGAMHTFFGEHIIELGLSAVHYESFGGTFYDSLDVKLVFRFRNKVNDETWYSYAIGQVNGELMIVEMLKGNVEDAVLYKYGDNGSTD